MLVQEAQLRRDSTWCGCRSLQSSVHSASIKFTYVLLIYQQVTWLVVTEV